MASPNAAYPGGYDVFAPGAVVPVGTIAPILAGGRQYWACVLTKFQLVALASIFLFLFAFRPCASTTLRASFGRPSRVDWLYFLSKYLADFRRSSDLELDRIVKDRQLLLVERLQLLHRKQAVQARHGANSLSSVRYELEVRHLAVQ
jgi:hypothetical protein